METSSDIDIVYCQFKAKSEWRFRYVSKFTRYLPVTVAMQTERTQCVYEHLQNKVSHHVTFDPPTAGLGYFASIVKVVVVVVGAPQWFSINLFLFLSLICLFLYKFCKFYNRYINFNVKHNLILKLS